MTYRLTRTWADADMQRKALWVAAMMSDAGISASELGISREGVVAQSAQETGWGKYIVGKHNLFGIKVGKGWTGAAVLVHTREVFNGVSVMVADWFRDYISFAASIADHLSFLKLNTRYAKAGVFDKKGDEHYFAALKRGGYATDPNYAANLLAVRDTVRNYFLPHMTESPVAVITTDPPRPPTTRRWLMIGNHGTDVLDLQSRLGLTADGWFGPMTRLAVIAFQKAHPASGPADGVVGDRTRVELWKDLA